MVKLIIVATQILHILSLVIDRPFNASVDAQASILERKDLSYWLADILHQGAAAFNPDSTLSSLQEFERPWGSRYV